MATDKFHESNSQCIVRRAAFVDYRVCLEMAMLLSLSVAFPACSVSDEHPPVYLIKGKVIFKGKPISGGTVVFEFDGENNPAGTKEGSPIAPLRATGRIEVDGSFRLMAFSGTEGVPEGKYKVGISSMPPRTEANLFDSSPSIVKGNPDVLRGKYSDPKNSGLRAEVFKDRMNEPTFDLK